jgi:hypothetical protein
MPTRPERQRTEITVEDACELLEQGLVGDARARILDALDIDADFPRACARLRNAMRAGVLPTGGAPLRLQPVVQGLDARARRGGLHVLETWDYRAHRFTGEINPVLMLDRCALPRTPAEERRAVLAVLLDFYLVSILGLIVVHAWDGADLHASLDRAGTLLHALQETGGSGCRFVDDVETLLLASVANYHPEEAAYDGLAERFDALAGAHRTRMGLACAAVLGGHLRWGLQNMYGRDVGRMREDNLVDYPLVVFGLSTLLERYDAMGRQPERPGPTTQAALPTAAEDATARLPLAEGVLNGLSADPRFALERTPSWLRVHREHHAHARETLLAHRDRLLGDFAAFQPSSQAFSPLGFDCNFLSNAMVAVVATAVAAPGARPSLNALFTRSAAAGWPADASLRHAHELAAYARVIRLSSDPAPLVTYDPRSASRAFNVTTTLLREGAAPAA